jgi:hypothetical protein
MSGRPASQHCQEFEGAYYWDLALAVPVIVSVLGILYFEIGAVVVVGYKVKVVEQNLAKAAECLMRIEDKDGCT